MHSTLFASCDWLRVENNQGYGALPIPSQRDTAISQLLDAWLSLDQRSRNAAISQLPDEYRFTLLGYSERMASLAVRTGDSRYIQFGLLAIGLDSWREDWRDNACLICLHYDAALRIGSRPSTVFEQAAALLPSSPANAIRSYLNRSSEDKSLQAMGYVAGADNDGFRYRRTW